MFTDSDICTVSRSYMYCPKFAITPTFTTIAIATVVSATAFFLIQQQEEYQKRRADEEKEAALKYQYLEQRLVNLTMQLENHAKLYGHEGVYELMGRVIQVESDHKALLFILNHLWGIKDKSDN